MRRGVDVSRDRESQDSLTLHGICMNEWLIAIYLLVLSVYMIVYVFLKSGLLVYIVCNIYSLFIIYLYVFQSQWQIFQVLWSEFVVLG